MKKQAYTTYQNTCRDIERLKRYFGFTINKRKLIIVASNLRVKQRILESINWSNQILFAVVSYIVKDVCENDFDDTGKTNLDTAQHSP